MLRLKSALSKKKRLRQKEKQRIAKQQELILKPTIKEGAYLS
jgi:hypothetical protein